MGDQPTSKPTSRPAKRSFAEVFYPARPQRLVHKARELAQAPVNRAQEIAAHLGPPTAANPAYVKWLERESMLHNALVQAKRYSGKAVMWQNPFAMARPRAAVTKASVWYTAYPVSTITRQGDSVLATLGDDELWGALERIGIQGIHTGPMKRAGGLNGWVVTPSIDGYFDRINVRLDALFGTEADYRGLCLTAREHGGIVIDDIIPGHTGKGPDFRLAEMGYGAYPGIYHMVEIHPQDWGLLPEVEKGHDAVNLTSQIEARLKSAGYIIGRLQRVIFFETGVKETNWSATPPVAGVDGVVRRWVYLHYFKDGQPTINWLDPSFAGMRLVVGDALHAIGELGATGLRLDANGFLGAEISAADAPAWSEGHPLSRAANQMIAGTVRKVGGFTFQELNLPMDDMKAMSTDGADLSYDFINRPAYHHALVSGDTEYLRLCLTTALELGLDPVSLVHALQNHDELTTELVHFLTRHHDDEYRFHGRTMKGHELRSIVRAELTSKITGKRFSYNLPFTDNGIACTTVSLIAAALGYSDLSALTTQEVERIKRSHLLLAVFNALQPGVFALSGWDLSGALTLDAERVKDLISHGDTRWISRGAYDLMGRNPRASSSELGMPRARSLYGTLPEQLADESSFASQLRNILHVRERYELATAHQLEIPVPTHPGLLVMLHRLSGDQLQATILNFSGETVRGSFRSPHLIPGSLARDMFIGTPAGRVDKRSRLALELGPHQATSLLFEPVAS